MCSRAGAGTIPAEGRSVSPPRGEPRRPRLSGPPHGRHGGITGPPLPTAARGRQLRRPRGGAVTTAGPGSRAARPAVRAVARAPAPPGGGRGKGRQAPPWSGTRHPAGAAAISDAAVKLWARRQRPVLPRRTGLGRPARPIGPLRPAVSEGWRAGWGERAAPLRAAGGGGALAFRRGEDDSAARPRRGGAGPGWAAAPSGVRAGAGVRLRGAGRALGAG